MHIISKNNFNKAYNHTPFIKKVQAELAEKFEGRAEIQKGITSPDLSFGDWRHIIPLRPDALL